jgi:hypothetical protein
LAALLLTLALALSASPAGAQPPPSDPATSQHDTEEESAESRATSFRAVDGAIVEDVPGGMMLVGAYGVIAALLLLFLFRQQSQLRELDGRVASLRAEIERGAGQKDNERG